MAGRKKTILDEVETVESAVAAELTQSNNLNKPGSTAKTTRTKKTAVTEEAEQPKKTTRTKKVAETEETTKTAKNTQTGKATKAKNESEPEQSDKVEKVTKTRKTAKADKAETTDAPKKVTKTRKNAKTEKAPEAEAVVVTDTVILTDTVTVTDKADDIVEYIQPSSLEALKARYGAAEEDEQIRNEGFELAKKSGLVRRPHPEETSFDYYSVPTASEDITTNVDISLSEAFDSTKSAHDADTVSFEDIATDKKPQPAVNPPVSQEAIRATGNRYGYDTHTTVIYYDESTDDGIQRNTEDELTSAFTTDSKRKRRIFPWLRKRK